MKPANLKTLALELNLSISTVSKALRDSYEISQETKKKVTDLAKEYARQACQELGPRRPVTVRRRLPPGSSGPAPWS